ncbi:MAG: hypothetical protein HQM08_28685 [Candidatus Riflebacteria bacterium]|nr:hypothetical protein [Candidatus Riflebacteria bacterium]
MLNSKRLIFLVFSTFLAWQTSFAFDELIDNPNYQNWSKFKVGTIVKYQQVGEKDGKQIVLGDLTYTLAELTPEKVVVEMTQTIFLSDQISEFPNSQMQYSAKIKKADSGSVKQLSPAPDESDEEIEVPAGKFKCHAIESSNHFEGASFSTKIWSNKDIPGALVKNTTNTEEPKKSTTSIVLVQVVKP